MLSRSGYCTISVGLSFHLVVTSPSKCSIQVRIPVTLFVVNSNFDESRTVRCLERGGARGFLWARSMIPRLGYCTISASLSVHLSLSCHFALEAFEPSQNSDLVWTNCWTILIVTLMRVERGGARGFLWARNMKPRSGYCTISVSLSFHLVATSPSKCSGQVRIPATLFVVNSNFDESRTVRCLERGGARGFLWAQDIYYQGQGTA